MNLIICHRKASHLVLLILVLGAFLHASKSYAQALVVRKAAQEVFEMVGKTLGREGAEELAEKVGREGVEKILVRAAEEGGEEAAERVARVVGTYGTRAVRVLDRSPAQLSRALDDLPANQVKQALYALERAPALLPDLAIKYGGKALTMELQHPGVGGKLLAKLGDDALVLNTQITTDQVGRVVHYADDIAAIPAMQRKALIEALTKTPERVLKALETHPKVLTALTSLGIVLPVGMKVADGTIEEQRADGTVIVKKGVLVSGGVSDGAREVGQGMGSGLKWAFIIVGAFVGIGILVWIRPTTKKPEVAKSRKNSSPKAGQKV